VIRGGAWFTDRRFIRVTYRRAEKISNYMSIDLGFRCAQSVTAAGGGQP